MFQETRQTQEGVKLPPPAIAEAIRLAQWPKVKELLTSAVRDGTFRKEDLVQALSAGADLRGLDLRNLPEGTLDSLKLEGGNLSEAQFPALKGTEFKKVKLNSVQFVETSLEKVTFDECELGKFYARKVKFDGVVFSGKQSMETPRFFESEMNGVKFELPGMKGGQFFDTIMNQVKLENLQLVGGSFINLKLADCNFKNADLRGSDWVLVTVNGGNDLTGAKYTGRERFGEKFSPEALKMVRGELDGIKELMPEETWRSFSARAGNPVPLVRQQLAALTEEMRKKNPDAARLDGAGRIIAHIEDVTEPVEPGRAPLHNRHSEAVAARMISTAPDGGLATGAKYQLIDSTPDSERLLADFDRFGGLRSSEDSKDALDQMLVRHATHLPSMITARLAEIADRQAANAELPRIDAVNISSGLSRALLCSVFERMITEDGYPRMYEAVYGEKAGELSPHARKQKLVDYVESKLNPDSNEAIKAAYKAYSDQTERLWSQGTIVVVSAGNDRLHLGEERPKDAAADWKPLKWQPGAELSVLARGKVLVVAASNSSATPEIDTDDAVARFSSRGDGVKTPTISAPGETVLISYNINDGTSFSAPYLVSTIALMRQVNPALSADGVEKILRETAYDNPAIPSSEEGAGQLRVVDAVRRAWEEGKNR